MTDATWQALFISMPPTIAAVGALIQGLRNGRKAEIVAKKAEIVAEKQEIGLQKTEEIQKLVNGNLFVVKTELATANAKIEKLQALVDKLVLGADIKTLVKEVVK